MGPLYNTLKRLLVIILTANALYAAGTPSSLPPGNPALLKEDSLAYRIFLSQPDSSIAIAKRTLNQAQKINDRYVEGFSYFVLSKAYWAKANFRLSAEYGFKSLKIFDNTTHSTMWGKTLLSIARTFNDLRNFEYGGRYIEQAIDLARKTGDTLLEGEGYREKSMLLSELRQFDSALHYADRGIKVFETFQDTLNTSILFGRKAKIYFFLGDYKKSQHFNKLSLLYDSLVGNNRALGISYYQAALDAIHLDQIDSAIILLRKSIPINRQIRNPAIQIKAHLLLADIYKEQKKLDLAFAELKLANQYKDSLYNSERNGQIMEMQSLYELSSKEEKIQQLAQDNMSQLAVVKSQRSFVAFLIVCVLLLGGGIYLSVRYRRLQEKTNAELALKNKDIEQQKEEIQSQAETLQQLNDLKLKLFSVISHDLRGPIGSLQSLLDLLSRQKISAEEFRMICDKLKNNVDVTQRTIENLLNWSLSQMEGIKSQPTVINIGSNISEACKLMSETAQIKSIDISNEFDDDLHVHADSNQVQLILRNLIHNAIKFSNPSEKIQIKASRVSDFCLITVKDSGIGMTSEEIATIKNSSQHFTKAGTNQEKGTGLGLLLCKEFIKLNGGDIDIKSNINQGTEIHFTLPLASN